MYQTISNFMNLRNKLTYELIEITNCLLLHFRALKDFQRCLLKIMRSSLRLILADCLPYSRSFSQNFPVNTKNLEAGTRAVL